MKENLQSENICRALEPSIKNSLGANNLRSSGKNMAELWLLISMVALYAGTKATLALEVVKTAA